MKLLVVTDIHGNDSVTGWINSEVRCRKADLVLVLGDITDFGPEEKAMDILGSIESRVYALPGNCDPRSLPNMISGIAVDMHGKTAEIGGYHVAGLGGSNPTIFDTPFELEEDEIYRILKPISEMGMILMVHAPSYGINDTIPSGVHVGSKSILRIVNEFRPILVLSGHIHEDFGIRYEDGTTFVNPGPARDGMYAIVEIDGSAVSAELFSIKES
ncbi:MAG: metallophosphoesterase [Candidatus Methanoplasma sp.]|jgi:Icc-related predicted phosphoesterase|nr:metallophosphoesterase [Candidatus Methanoplasma sp.]